MIRVLRRRLVAVTVILTNAELLSSGEYPEGDQNKFTGYILTMARQMRGLVEELLDLARVDSGLPAARNIIKQHKGKLWVQSKDGNNTFHVRLSTVRTGSK